MAGPRPLDRALDLVRFEVELFKPSPRPMSDLIEPLQGAKRFFLVLPMLHGFMPPQLRISSTPPPDPTPIRRVQAPGGRWAFLLLAPPPTQKPPTTVPR